MLTYGMPRDLSYTRGQLAFHQEGVSIADPHEWRFAPVSQGERAHVEQFIRCAFLRSYGARIMEFMPHLMALYMGNELMAACGLRYAARERLYLEAYLDQPIERVLETATGSPEARGGVAEVGNLAISRPGAARSLIAQLTKYLAGLRYTWAVFTAVPALRNNFARLRIPVSVLGSARSDHLEAGVRNAWGTYYDQAPKVTSVRVADAAAALAGIR